MNRPRTPDGALARRFEAIVFDWDTAAVPARAAGAGRLRSAIEAACGLGLNLAIVSDASLADLDRQLAARPAGPGRLHLLVDRGSLACVVDRDGPTPIETGPTGRSDSVRWYLEAIWRRGVHPEQVLSVGDELGGLSGARGGGSQPWVPGTPGPTVVSVGVEPFRAGASALEGGPAALERLLRDQIELRRSGALPIGVRDPEWTVRIEGVDHIRERANESVLSVADGRLGTRGTPLAPHRGTTPLVLHADAYHGHGEHSELEPAPLWNRVDVRAPLTHLVRTLDLHAGLLMQELPGDVTATLFTSLAHPGIAVLRLLARPALLDAGPPLVAPGAGAVPDGDPPDAEMTLHVDGGTLGAAGRQSTMRCAEGISLERIAAYAFSEDDGATGVAGQRLRDAWSRGPERLLVEHRAAWAERWHDADIRIEGRPELQRAVRLALYHLMGCAAEGGASPVGARGLSGRGYRGHVFWDADVFVLPFHAATHPACARSMLEYRLRCLPAAMAAARFGGHAGARFAWESAATGEDVTPRAARDRAGNHVAIYTGQLEEHITADVAWAAGCYLDWTADAAFRNGPAQRLFVETARYWASRVERDPDGTAHIRGVIGPDEYHERVDDNAYTNVMARWNLRRAYSETTDTEVDHRERTAWREIADALVDGYRPESGLYEQFDGFFGLEPLVIERLAPRRPIAADLLLSRERVQQAQVVKQADVLMLYHLIPDDLAPGSLAPNIAFYEPRTAHGSSLSPGVHAALLARAQRLKDAVAMLELTARVDLDDISQSTGGGVHIAAMGSVWQALTYGFAGARACGELLALDPHLPEEWGSLEVRLRFHGARVRARVTAEEVEVSSDHAVRVRVTGHAPTLVRTEPTRFELRRVGSVGNGGLDP